MPHCLSFDKVILIACNGSIAGSEVWCCVQNLQDRLMAHKVHIEDSVERASEAAATYVRQQFG